MGVSTHISATSTQRRVVWLGDSSDRNSFVCLAIGSKGCDAAGTHAKHHKGCGPFCAQHVALLLGEDVLRRSSPKPACTEAQLCSRVLVCTQRYIA